jgi:hypothetical protein
MKERVIGLYMGEAVFASAGETFKGLLRYNKIIMYSQVSGLLIML